MHDYCHSKPHESSILGTDVMFCHTCGVAVVVDKGIMVCLNQVTVRKTLQENSMDMDTITRKYV